jgi:hypothetical protein
VRGRAAYGALLQGKSINQIADESVDVLANGSELVKFELLQRIKLSIMGAEAYRLFFKKMNMT